jgi:hypothetical protein
MAVQFKMEEFRFPTIIDTPLQLQYVPIDFEQSFRSPHVAVERKHQAHRLLCRDIIGMDM